MMYGELASPTVQTPAEKVSQHLSTLANLCQMTPLHGPTAAIPQLTHFQAEIAHHWNNPSIEVVARTAQVMNHVHSTIDTSNANDVCTFNFLKLSHEFVSLQKERIADLNAQQADGMRNNENLRLRLKELEDEVQRRKSRNFQMPMHNDVAAYSNGFLHFPREDTEYSFTNL